MSGLASNKDRCVVPNVKLPTGIDQGERLMPEPIRNVDGSPIKDTKEKEPRCLTFLGFFFVIIPLFIFERVSKIVRRGRYWRLSDGDYDILRRKERRKKMREEEGKWR